ADAHSVFSILNTQPFKQTYFPKAQAEWKGLKVAIPQADALEFYSYSGQLAAFEHSLDELRNLGAEIIPVDFSPLRETALLLYEGPWLSERWAAVGSFVEEHPNDVHPVIKDLIEKAKTY